MPLGQHQRSLTTNLGGQEFESFRAGHLRTKPRTFPFSICLPAMAACRMSLLPMILARSSSRLTLHQRLQEIGDPGRKDPLLEIGQHDFVQGCRQNMATLANGLTLLQFAVLARVMLDLEFASANI